MTERKASMGDKVYRGDVVKFIRNNISLGTFMKRTVIRQTKRLTDRITTKLIRKEQNEIRITLQRQ